MRLIDADKLPWVDRVILVDQVDGDINITIAKEHTSYVNDETPTVEAIPVEWLLKRAKLCTADYANCLRYSIEVWRTEQKCMVNGRWKFPKEWEKENEVSR